MLLRRIQRKIVSALLFLCPETPSLMRVLCIVEWADLPVIDIRKAATLEGRSELVALARDAMRTQGFLYIVNHGYTQAQVGINLL